MLYHMINEEIEFMMEVTKRSDADGDTGMPLFMHHNLQQASMDSLLICQNHLRAICVFFNISTGGTLIDDERGMPHLLELSQEISRRFTPVKVSLCLSYMAPHM